MLPLLGLILTFAVTQGSNYKVLHGDEGDDTLSHNGDDHKFSFYGEGGNDLFHLHPGDKANGGEGSDIFSLVVGDKVSYTDINSDEEDLLLVYIKDTENYYSEGDNIYVDDKLLAIFPEGKFSIYETI